MSATEFDGQPMTKRELLLARKAVDDALARAWPWIRRSEFGEWIGADNIRDDLYPLPKITRPRVWVEPVCGMGWKVVDGDLYFTFATLPAHVHWYKLDTREPTHAISPERIRAWSDLLANPTEEVEDGR